MAPTSSSTQKRKGPIERKKKYDDEQMLAALSAVKNGVPVSTAARKYGVPRITLLYKATGKSPISGRPGPESILKHEEERVLVLWMNNMFRAGFSVTASQLKDSVQHLLKTELKRNTPFTDGRPGKRWLQCFKDRHPSISDQFAENLTVSRASVTKEDIASWFERTKKHLWENSLFEVLEDPRRVFNGDEAAFFLNPKGKMVLAPRGAKNVYLNVSNEEKECLTVFITANACGDLAPPMVVFKYKELPEIIAQSVPDGWGIGKSDNGWMTSLTFYEYVTQIFEPWLECNDVTRPILFFLDGHTCYLTYHLSDFCLKKQIILISFPPNQTHIMQPMDVSVFQSLKKNWESKFYDWRVKQINEPNILLKTKDFCPLFNEVIKEIIPATIANGFRKCGLVPWDMSSISLFCNDTSTCFPPKSSLISPSLAVINCRVTNQQTNQSPKPLSKSAVLQSLLVLERFIGKEKVESFQKSTRGNRYIEDSSLFKIWKRMRKCCFMESINEDPVNTSEEEFSDQEFHNVPQAEQHSMMCVDTTENYHKSPRKTSTSGKPGRSNRWSCQVSPINASESGRSEPIAIKAITHLQPNSIVRPSNLIVPSPFKTALSRPDAPRKTVKNRNKGVIPSEVSSSDYKNYLKRKIEKKAEEEDNKKARALDLFKKKEAKEQIKLQKAAEREKKKTMMQSKKECTRVKKSKKIPEISSDDDGQKWEPQDQSDKSSIKENDSIQHSCADMVLFHNSILNMDGTGERRQNFISDDVNQIDSSGRNMQFDDLTLNIVHMSYEIEEQHEANHDNSGLHGGHGITQTDNSTFIVVEHNCNDIMEQHLEELQSVEEANHFHR